jgi:hypothetical protein
MSSWHREVAAAAAVGNEGTAAGKEGRHMKQKGEAGGVGTFYLKNTGARSRLDGPNFLLRRGAKIILAHDESRRDGPKFSARTWK